MSWGSSEPPFPPPFCTEEAHEAWCEANYSTDFSDGEVTADVPPVSMSDLVFGRKDKP